MTLDLDFADVTRFRAVRTAGIVVIRVPRNPSLPLLESLIRQLLTALDRMPIGGDLWIVEIGRVRVYQYEANGHADPGGKWFLSGHAGSAPSSKCLWSARYGTRRRIRQAQRKQSPTAPAWMAAADVLYALLGID